MNKKQGRPTTYTEELGNRICLRISNGESLRKICKDEDMPSASTVHLWVLENRQKFSEQYTKSRAIQAEHMFEEILEIADDGTNDTTMKSGPDGSTTEVFNNDHYQRSRLRVDTRKWYLSKVLPKKFGDKLDMTSNGETIKGNTVVFKDFNETDSKSEI